MKLMASEQDRATIIRWVRLGSPRDGWESQVREVVAANCTRCHGTLPGLVEYRSYEGIKSVSQIDEGATVPTLARVFPHPPLRHRIHLLLCLSHLRAGNGHPHLASRYHRSVSVSISLHRRVLMVGDKVGSVRGLPHDARRFRLCGCFRLHDFDVALRGFGGRASCVLRTRVLGERVASPGQW